MVQIEHGYLHRAWCAAGAILGRPGGSLQSWWWQHDEALQPECSGPCDATLTPQLDPLLTFLLWIIISRCLPLSYPTMLPLWTLWILALLLVSYAPDIVHCLLCAVPLLLRPEVSLLFVAALPNVSPHNTADIWIWTSYFDQQMEFM